VPPQIAQAPESKGTSAHRVPAHAEGHHRSQQPPPAAAAIRLAHAGTGPQMQGRPRAASGGKPSPHRPGGRADQPGADPLE